MRKILHIKRKNKDAQDSYWQDFEFNTEDEAATVATALKGFPITWDHSCLQKKCGACAMVINGKPGLDIVNIEPLRKFPVIEDLLVDRSTLTHRLKDNEVWFQDKANHTGEEVTFEASKCLQCGLCLEVCPNFYNEGSYGGMALMSGMTQIMYKADVLQKKTLRKNYKANVYEGCGKSLACRDICPAGIDMENLLVKNAAALLWNKWDSEAGI